jgi:hypothetical protein
MIFHIQLVILGEKMCLFWEGIQAPKGRRMQLISFHMTFFQAEDAD